MEKKISALPNQSLLDIILQATGTLETGMQLASDNDIPLSYLPNVGNNFLLSKAAITRADTIVLRYLSQNSIVIGTMSNTAHNGLITEDADDNLTTEDETTFLTEES